MSVGHAPFDDERGNYGVVCRPSLASVQLKTDHCPARIINQSLLTMYVGSYARGFIGNEMLVSRYRNDICSGLGFVGIVADLRGQASVGDGHVFCLSPLPSQGCAFAVLYGRCNTRAPYTLPVSFYTRDATVEILSRQKATGSFT